MECFSINLGMSVMSYLFIFWFWGTLGSKKYFTGSITPSQTYNTLENSTCTSRHTQCRSCYCFWYILLFFLSWTSILFTSPTATEKSKCRKYIHGYTRKKSLTSTLYKNYRETQLKTMNFFGMWAMRIYGEVIYWVYNLKKTFFRQLPRSLFNFTKIGIFSKHI